MSLFARPEESLSVDDFLDMELNAPDEEKWELLGGTLWRMMAGGTVAHNTIVQNIASTLRNKLRKAGSPCRPFTENLKLIQRELELVAYPDVMVHCGPFGPDQSSLTDPVVLIEVLSPGTRTKDIGEKGPLYRRVPSVRQILFVSQSSRELEVYSASGDIFTLARVSDRTAEIELGALGVTLTMDEIYLELDV